MKSCRRRAGAKRWSARERDEDAHLISSWNHEHERLPFQLPGRREETPQERLVASAALHAKGISYFLYQRYEVLSIPKVLGTEWHGSDGKRQGNGVAKLETTLVRYSLGHLPKVHGTQGIACPDLPRVEVWASSPATKPGIRCTPTPFVLWHVRILVRSCLWGRETIEKRFCKFITFLDIDPGDASH